LVVHELAVDRHAQLGHAGAAAARHHHVVHGHAAIDHGAVAHHAPFEQAALLGGGLALQNFAERRQHALDRDVGNEAEAAEVDADEGDFVLGQLARNAEHGAVAAHHDDQIGLLADGVDVHGFNAGHAEVGRGIGLEHHAVAGVLEKAQDALDGFLDAGRVLPHHERDELLRLVCFLLRGHRSLGSRRRTR